MNHLNAPLHLRVVRPNEVGASPHPRPATHRVRLHWVAGRGCGLASYDRKRLLRWPSLVNRELSLRLALSNHSELTHLCSRSASMVMKLTFSERRSFYLNRAKAENRSMAMGVPGSQKEQDMTMRKAELALHQIATQGVCLNRLAIGASSKSRSQPAPFLDRLPEWSPGSFFDQMTSAPAHSPSRPPNANLPYRWSGEGVGWIDLTRKRP